MGRCAEDRMSFCAAHRGFRRGVPTTDWCAACEGQTVDARREARAVAADQDVAATRLGPIQRDWLLEGVQNSDADFIFVISSVNFMVPHVGGGGAAFDAATKDDAWTVFLDEREKLIEFWDAL